MFNFLEFVDFYEKVGDGENYLVKCKYIIVDLVEGGEFIIYVLE